MSRRSSSAPPILSASAKRIGLILVDWYQREHRALPWREHPEPYAVWVSEVMLQQTQVETVVPYFLRWMTRFPDLVSLARADENAVLKEWQGLGYYSRARSLLRCAQVLAASGQETLPDTAEQLRRLPGIGPYTAGAIASIAFGRDEPLVDGNVNRVLTRLLALEGDPSKEPLRSRLWQTARQLLVPGRAAEFNQALMELGALVCRPREPACTRCPLRRECAAHKSGATDRYPTPKLRAPATPVRMAAALCRRGAKVLLVQQPADAVWWAGLWTFPSTKLAEAESFRAAAKRAVVDWTGLGVIDRFPDSAPQKSIQHSVTRYRIELVLHAFERVSGSLTAQTGSRARWLAVDALQETPMPAPHRKLARSALL